MTAPWTWLIVGSSGRLGRALVEYALGLGDNVAATARDATVHAELRAQVGSRLLPVALDVRDTAAVQACVSQVVAEFGGVDVVIYNVGYGQIGAVEELTDAEWHEQFEVNFFGAVRVARSVTPHLRARGRGAVMLTSSSGRFQRVAGAGPYLASKHALVGLADALREELRPFGVGVWLVTPGALRTEFATSLIYPTSPLPEYARAIDSVRDMMAQMHGRQPGDPDRAAQVIARIALAGNTGVGEVLIGSDALHHAEGGAARAASDLDSSRSFAAEADLRHPAAG
jgi:NAD(P)-dependent dehydrogenase (short-subunit alcohol dehydrogenase family)